MELDISDYGSIEDGTLDEELVSATIEAYNTGKLTPLLKTELKYRIQKKCFEEGKDLTLDEEPQIVQRKAPLLPFELEKQEKRREQNRRAAKKFRVKKRQASGEINKSLVDEEEKNRQLKEEIKRLLGEIEMFRSALSDHLCITTGDVYTPGETPLQPRDIDTH
uniref:Activating transcription factor 3-like n=1 Tax=Crassostrea virginica TaxID=6565 RepID=A0A8B8DVY6_CRAVI|nr:activating transcription factor 3-like [Crassostrea virginica]XP_022332396.1 activating transcription factor 3-like [Crassostrea virginica]XP_022332397.1 activating transcription factor 3-like [Crassostrea virginica]XP_022333329.1 activating transcription factor 3-like [Crassostrea virginica]